VRPSPLALLAVVCGAVVCSCSGGKDETSHTPVVGCDQRIEGGPLPRRPGDKVIGGVNFFNLPAGWSDQQANEAKNRGRLSGLLGAPMKQIVTVPAGMTITVVVPRGQRRWFALGFDTSTPRRFERPGPAITFKACRRTKSRAQLLRECDHVGGNACRWGYTEFNGGIYVDFDRAPQRGRCALLYVQRAGTRKPIVGYPFVNDASTCRR
jgi:hypothetical protein